MYKFRLFKLLLAYLMGKRQPDVLGPVTVQLRLTPFEVELSHASSYAYMAYAALGRWSWTLACMDLRRMLRERWTPFTHSELVYYRRALPLFSRVELCTRLIWWDEKMAYFEHRVTQDGQLAALVYSRGAYYARGKRIAMTDAAHDAAAGPPSQKPDIVEAWAELDRVAKKGLA